MSRNLASTTCAICIGVRSGIVVLEERPRPCTATDLGIHARYLGHFLETLTVANAHCVGCGAKYLAWVGLVSTAGHPAGTLERVANDPREFVDLSFRSTFYDEPGAADLPSRADLADIHNVRRQRRIEDLRARARQLVRDAEEMQARETESPWERYRRE